MKKLILVLLLFITSILNAQTNQFEELGKYSRFGLLIGGDLYNKARLEPEYGDLTFKNLPIPSYSFGFEYDLFPKNRWSVSTGLIYVLEPLANFKVSFDAKDISDTWSDGMTIRSSGYAWISPSIPVFVTFKERISDNVFLELRTGIKVKYYRIGVGRDHQINMIDDTIARTVFGLRMENIKQNGIYGSFVFGAGLNFLTKWSLIKVNLVYNYSFQNIVEGEYLFDNLFVSKRTYGKYYLSGNYFGLNAVFHLKRGLFNFKPKKSYTINLPF